MKERRRVLPPTTAETTGEPSWRWRRFVTLGIIGVCLIWIPSLGFFPPIDDTLVNQKIIEGCFTLIGWALLIYVGAATGQDITAIIKTGSGRPYAPTPGVVETTKVETTKTAVTPDPNAVDPNNPPPGFAA